MDSAICTLFEGGYHVGLAALANSLYKVRYRGIIWVGYRGPLPPWVRSNPASDGVVEHVVAEGCSLRFVTVSTERHLTNYKPEFMREVWARRCPQAGALFYFDPDIVVRCEWSFFEEWVKYGIAMCEDVNSPMPASHPIRYAWKHFYAPHNLPLTREFDIYVNGGFVGIPRASADFLTTWQKIVDLMEPVIGDLKTLGVRNRTFLFNKTDQDGLNIAAMATDFPVSIVGRDGMDFAPGGYIMSHSAGAAKPWKRKFIREALGGRPPSSADKDFWSHVETPICPYSKSRIALGQASVRIASAIGRFVMRV